MAFEVTDVINRNDNLWQLLKALPKVELHRHLEGTIRLNTLMEVAMQYDIPLPATTAEELRPFVQMTAEDMPTHSQFLSKFSILRQFFVDEDVIRRVAREAVEDAAADNIRYMELRFTPYALAKLKKFPLHEVVAWVSDSVQEAATAQGIKVNLIIAMNRHESVEIGEAMMRTALDYMGRGVVGVDLCGNEVNHPSTPFTNIFLEAQNAGLGITIHAGEWAGPDNVIEAIEGIGTIRIGHGIRSVEDSYALRLALENNVYFEICPTSNMQTGVVNSMDHHPLYDMQYVKANITINTDDPAISNTTLTDEYAFFVQGLGFSLHQLRTYIFNAIQAAFLSDDDKIALQEQFQEELDMLILPEIES